jgi:hypothetical protein
MKKEEKKIPVPAVCRRDPRPEHLATDRRDESKNEGKPSLRELEQQLERINPDPDSLDRG